jgi:dolichol-phosphate mannosyltransferase
VSEIHIAEIETYVIVLTYNEADNIEERLTQLLDLPAPIGVIVFDDNSPDGTGRLADTWVAASRVALSTEKQMTLASAA